MHKGSDVTIAAAPQFQTRDDERTLSDGEGHTVPGSTEYLILPYKSSTLRIPWRMFPSSASDRPTLSEETQYQFVIRIPADLSADRPTVRKIYSGEKLIYEAKATGKSR